MKNISKKEFLENGQKKVEDINTENTFNRLTIKDLPEDEQFLPAGRIGAPIL